jgi:hypothetical protein
MSVPEGSTGSHPLALHDDVRYLTKRLIDEYLEFPAGSVMRCVARAVRRALMARTPPRQLVTRAEHTAREALASRLAAVGQQGRRSVEPQEHLHASRRVEKTGRAPPQPGPWGAR